MKTLHTTARAQRALLLLAILLTGTFASLTFPLFKQHASAVVATEDTVIDLPGVGTNKGTVISCQGYFTSATKTFSLVQRAFNDVGQYGLQNTSDMDGLGSIGLSPSEISYLENGLGTVQTPYIHFDPSVSSAQAVNGSRNLGGDTTTASAVCNTYVMVPVSATKYIMLTRLSDTSADAGLLTYTIGSSTATSTTGTLQYDLASIGNCNSPSNPQCSRVPSGVINTKSGTANGFKMNGTPNTTTTPTPVSVGAITISWDNADQFTVIAASGNNGSINYVNYVGDVYQKQQWGDSTSGKSYYMLTTAGSSIPRTVWSSNQGCVDPMPGGQDPTKGTCSNSNGQAITNCVPFFAIDDDLSVINATASNLIPTSTGIAAMQNAINNLGDGSTNITFYDYTPSGSSCTANAPTPAKNIVQRGFPKIWFYYSAADDEFITVFTSSPSGSVASNYIGTYSKAGGSALYSGPASTCAGQISGKPLGLHQVYTLDWTLLSPNNCNNPTTYGTLRVYGTTVDEATFTALQNAVLNNSNTTVNTPQLACDILAVPVISWIMCPIIDGAEALAAQLDNVINNLLTINTDPQSPASIFYNGSSNDYRIAFNAFRTIALGFLAISALIMVLAEAAGVEFLSALTLRKLFFRVPIAAFVIVILWPLLRDTATFANDLGNGVSSLIYSPFSGVAWHAQLQGGSTVVFSLIGGGAAIAFGWLGLLSFVGTAALAAMVGVGVLVFRQLLFTILVLTAAPAIAASILPPFRKPWVFWRDSYGGVLFSFAIISGITATFRVFGLASLNQTASNGGLQTIYQLIAIGAYFGSYFAYIFAIRFTSGAMRTIGGFANDRTRGAFDRLKNVRGKQLSDRYKGAVSGNRRYIPAALGGNQLNGAIRRVSQAGNGGLSVTARGRARYNAAQQKIFSASARQALESDHGRMAGDDNANALALQTGMTRNRFVREYMARAGVDRQTATNAMTALEVNYGAQMGTGAMQVAALQARAASGTGYAPGDYESMTRDAAEVMNSGAMTAVDVAAAFKANKARADQSGVGFNTWLGQLDRSAARARAGDATLVTNNEAQSLRHDALHGSEVGAIMGSRHETITALAPQMLKEFQDAMESGDQNLIAQKGAAISGMYSLLGNISQQKAAIFSSEVMSRQFSVPDGAGGTRTMNVQRITEELKNNNPQFATFRQDFVQSGLNSYAAFQAANQQAAAQAGMPPPGAMGGI